MSRFYKVPSLLCDLSIKASSGPPRSTGTRDSDCFKELAPPTEHGTTPHQSQEARAGGTNRSSGEIGDFSGVSYDTTLKDLRRKQGKGPWKRG